MTAAVSPTIRVGFDVGGTFTDVVVTSPDHGVLVEKVLTTPSDPSEGVKSGITAALARIGASEADVEIGIHATTLVTNAIIERRGAVTGLVTTRGFRDVLEIAGGARYDVYDLFLPFPEVLVERRYRREVPERMNADGEVLEPLDEAAVRQELQALQAAGVQAVAVCFLHSYRADAHERAAAELARREFPKLAVTVSSDVSGELGEYERFSTAVANAYVQPLMQSYLAELESWLKESRLLLMGSNGGTISVETASAWPISLIESGPAAGALVAANHARRIGLDQVISFDMGGTTAKVCLIDDGQPSTIPQFEAARAERFKPGSGLPIRVPVVNLIEIGAGGGSIARVNDLGLLKVGPKSAGADPGPACYGLGGTQPTVTDANLVLGYLDADSFLGGDMKLDLAEARNALGGLGAKLGIDAEAAAWGVHDVVNEAMASAMRMHVAERNRDPRKYSVVAFGGAGPAHAAAVARKVGIREVVVPAGAGAASAFGLLIAAPLIELSHSHISDLSETPWDDVEAALSDLAARAIDLIAQTGVAASDVTIERTVDMRYLGQAHEINVPVRDASISRASEDTLRRDFVDEYSRVYSTLHPSYPIEITTWRVRATGTPNSIDAAAGPAADASRTIGERRVYFHGHGYVDTPVYNHAELAAGQTIQGPAIVEQREATTVIGVEDAALVDADQNLVIRINGGEAE